MTTCTCICPIPLTQLEAEGLRADPDDVFLDDIGRRVVSREIARGLFAEKAKEEAARAEKARKEGEAALRREEERQARAAALREARKRRAELEAELNPPSPAEAEAFRRWEAEADERVAAMLTYSESKRESKPAFKTPAQILKERQTGQTDDGLNFDAPPLLPTVY